jgi:hypothetical protein
MVETAQGFLVFSMPKKIKRWSKRKRLEKIVERGSCCELCYDIENLEFAHIFSTSLNGQGRGQWKRTLDLLTNPEAYLLLCKNCHTKLDKELDSDKDGQDYWF